MLITKINCRILQDSLVSKMYNNDNNSNNNNNNNNNNNDNDNNKVNNL